MRPIYETSADKMREQKVREYITACYNCSYEKTPALASVDGYLYHPDGALAALVEIKTRKNEYNKYPTYMLSAAKWKEGLAQAKQLNVPSLLVVSFVDGVFLTQLKEDYEIRKGGRFDRGDPRDLEDCIYIPIDQFKNI